MVVSDGIMRRELPIFYYNIWDDLPYQRWNEPFYECDLIMNISKQTHNIVDKVCRNKPRTDWDSTYVYHTESITKISS